MLVIIGGCYSTPIASNRPWHSQSKVRSLIQGCGNLLVLLECNGPSRPVEKCGFQAAIDEYPDASAWPCNVAATKGCEAPELMSRGYGGMNPSGSEATRIQVGTYAGIQIHMFPTIRTSIEFSKFRRSYSIYSRMAVHTNMHTCMHTYTHTFPHNYSNAYVEVPHVQTSLQVLRPQIALDLSTPVGLQISFLLRSTVKSRAALSPFRAPAFSWSKVQKRTSSHTQRIKHPLFEASGSKNP